MNKKQIITICAIIGIATSVLTACKDGKAIDTKADSGTEINDTEINGTQINTLAATNTAVASFHIPAKLTDRPTMLVKHSGHILSYNTKNNTPNWVAWQLTKAMTKGNLERSTKFWADEKIPKPYRVDYYEYKESVYDRGHMCPAGDCKWSQDAMHDCFYMSNMCPQDKQFNSHAWATLESKCRDWANKEGMVFICCGPYYAPGKKHQAIGIHHKVLVPDGFFKVVLSLRKGKEKAIGFYYTNTPNSQPLAKAACSVDDIERKTGIDFFADLNDALENEVEKMNDISVWR